MVLNTGPLDWESSALIEQSPLNILVKEHIFDKGSGLQPAVLLKNEMHDRFSSYFVYNLEHILKQKKINSGIYPSLYY